MSFLLHSWALASRPMPPASTFQHPVSQPGTGAFLYRTGSGIGAFVHSSIGLIRFRTVRHSDIDKEAGTPRKSTLETEGSGNCYTLYVHRRLLLVLLELHDVEKSYVNAGMPEKVNPALFTGSQLFSPAPAFRHQGQSGTAGHGLFRRCPAMLFRDHSGILSATE